MIIGISPLITKWSYLLCNNLVDNINFLSKMAQANNIITKLVTTLPLKIETTTKAVINKYDRGDTEK